MSDRETVRALVSAFNVHNYARNTVKTNFMLQSMGGKDCIVVSFDKGMGRYQCSRYLDSIKRKIIREFYGIEESNDKEILDTAKLIFDVKSFPFDMSKGEWFRDEQNGFQFVTPIDQGVIFNLKSHLASSLEKDVLEDMRISSTTVPFNKGKYLCCSKFDNKELRKEFEHEFLLRMKERKYENVPKNPLEIEGNDVYIKDVFDNARFIDSVTRYITWLIGRDLQADSKSRNDVKAFKDLIMEFINQPEGLIAIGFMCAPPLNGKGASILIPVILDSKGFRALTNKEALSINGTFDGAVFVDIDGKTQAELPVNGSSGIYGINFYDLQISHCVVTKIIESSVINAKHELSIDPELPRTLLTEPSPKQEFPTRSHGEELEKSPRRGSEKKQVLHNPVNLAGTSEGFSPRSHLNFTTVNHGVSAPSSSLPSVGAAANVPASTNLWTQQPNPWSLQSTSGRLPMQSGDSSYPQQSFSGPIRFSSRGSRPPLYARPPSVRYEDSGYSRSPRPPQLIPPPPPPPPLIPISGGSVSGSRLPVARPSSRKGANKSGSAWTSQPMGHWSSQSSNLKEDCKKICEDFEEAYEKIVSDSSLSKEKQELFKALLYWFNLNNYALDPLHTNFIVKNGKIASLIDDSVNVKEYLQKVIDKTKKEYRVNKKEAYDLNEFPFKFLSNCEKNQETTVVANISRGALLNLKKLFIQEQEHEKEVEIKGININIVKKAVKSKKDEWVDLQVKKCRVRPREAIITCYPDENELERIPIIKDKGEYCLDRTYEICEVESYFKERWCAEGTSKAGKVNPEDNKDSGYSSGFVTDAEKVSSKADAITSSGYESMDYENTRGGSPKRSGEEVVQAFKKQCIISTQIEDVTSESFRQRQGSIVG